MKNFLRLLAFLSLLCLVPAGFAATFSGEGVLVQDEGTTQGRARTMNFTGTGVSTTVNPATSTATVDVLGGGDLTEVQGTSPITVTSGTGPIPIIGIDVPVNAQVGTTYTYLDGDRGKLVTHSNAAAIAATLPNAAGAGFDAGWFMDVRNLGTGVVTITPTTSTIDGLTRIRLPRGRSIKIMSNGTNYFTMSLNDPTEKIFVDSYGADPTGGTDSTTAIQAALTAAARAAASYNLGSSGLPATLQNPHLPSLQAIHFTAGGMYVVSNQLEVPTNWWGLIEGNGATLLWNGNDNTKWMWHLPNVRELRMQNMKMWAISTRLINAFIMSKRTDAAGITPTAKMFSNLKMYCVDGGCKYGIRLGQGVSDGNDEFNYFENVDVNDYSETAFSIEHSQSKGNTFINSTFNSGGYGKRGVSLFHPADYENGNGSFYWFGGGGGSNSIADFQINGPIENILIDGGKFESSARFLTTPFYEVVSGLVGTDPGATLTMTTPSGSAYVQTAVPILVTNAGFTYTYTASKDTYDILQTNGTVLHYEVAVGAALDYPGTPGGTFLQRVRTNGTEITAVTALGGRHGSPSGAISPLTIKNIGWSSSTEAWDGNVITWFQRGSLTLIGNRFFTKTSYGYIDILASNDTDVSSGKLTMIGNDWRTELSGPWPSLTDRIRFDRGDSTYGTAGVDVARSRVISFGDSYANASGYLDVPGMPKFEILDSLQINDRWVLERSPLSRGLASSVLTGTIDPAASTTVTGVGTKFLTELVVGDRITVTGETRTVTAIASDTSLTVDTAFSDNANDTSPDRLSAIHVWKDSSGNNVMILDDQKRLCFEGATVNAFQTCFSITDPTAARLVTVPDGGSVTVQPDTGAANNFLTAISALGVVSKAQPAFSNLSGAATDAQVPNNITIDLAATVTTNANLTGPITSTGNATALGKADVMDAVNFCLDAGANDTYACSLSPAITAYVTGTHYRFKANTVNTGPATINFNAVGAKTIVKVAGGITTALADNDIRAGQWVDLVYDGTNMQMQSLLGNAPGTGGGDVVGPASATDECFARFDTTTGKLLQNSVLCATDAGVVTAGSGGTAGGSIKLGNATGDTAASFFEGNSGDGLLNIEPGYVKLWSSHATKRQASIYPCTNADGFFCISAVTPVTDGTSTILTALQSSTVGQALRVTAANTYTFGALDLADTDAVTGVLPNANTTATSANTASAIVARDGSGNFSAGTITAGLTGTASVAATGDSATSFFSTGTLEVAIGGTGTTTSTGTGSVVLGTAPTIAGGTHTAITSLGVRSTGTGAFDLKIANAENLTVSDKTLTIALNDANRTLTVAGAATISGTNTGDQTITLTGDVTGSGTGSFATTIAADSVALGTDTTGDYVSGVTASQGLLKTGTEGATLGLIDCLENQILKNTGVGGTAWTCAADADTGSQTPWTANINAAGFTLFGNNTASGNLTLDSTSHATKGYTILNPSGGNVGIGTATPGALFDTKTATNRHVVIRDQAAGSQILGAIDGVANYAGLLIDGTTVQFNTTSGGLVGIGGVPAAAKLEVFGDALTGSASAGVLSFAQTWNTTGAPVAVRFTITDTASHANSKAWQILGGASGTTNLLEVSKAGVVTAPTLNSSSLTASRCVETDASKNLVSAAAVCGTGGNHNFLSATHPDTLAASPVLGDIVHGNVTPAWARLAGNITTAKQFLTQTGTGAVSAVPVWGAITDADVPNNITIDLATTATTANAGDSATAFFSTGILEGTIGGTGSGFTAFTGPTTSLKTFTLPDASSTLLYSGGALGTPSSGTATNITGLPLTTGVTGILGSANGGTGNGFTLFSGPATTEKTFTLPNASTTILTTNAAVTIAQGGTGTASTLTGLVRGSATAMTAAELSGDVTTSGSNAATIAANAVTAAKSAVVMTRRVCTMVVGADNGSALVDLDLGPQRTQCKMAQASTAVEIDVSADAGTPSVIVGRRRCTTFTAGVCSAWTVVNLTSAALAAPTGGFEACSKTTAVTGLDGGTTCSGTLQNTALSAGDWIELVSGTAGGTAKRMSISVITTVD